MAKPGVFMLTLVLLISLTACATFQQREKQLTAEYPEWSPEIINKVSRGLVDVGMTEEQVRQALVMPQRYFIHDQGDKWSWVNETDYTREGRQEWGQVALFKDGRVVELKRFMAIPNSLVYVEWQ